jgi:hypothetical protein
VGTERKPDKKKGSVTDGTAYSEVYRLTTASSISGTVGGMAEA